MVDESGLRQDANKTVKFLRQKTVLYPLIIILLLIIFFSSISIRTQNIELLKDSTNGKTIPLALDPYYFMRIAETMTQGDLPAYDAMRAPGMNIEWSPEILPSVVVGMYTFTQIFGSEMTVRDVHVLSPVIFFAIGLLVFYFLAHSLIKSKVGALLASAFLAFTPSYLYRTTAGFADHDALGMIAIFACFLIYGIGLRRFQKTTKQTVLWGALLGLMTTLILVTWGGAITFSLLVIPTAFLLHYLLTSRNHSKSLIFYLTWVVSSTIFPIFFGYSFRDMINRFSGAYGLLVPFVLVFILLDVLIEKRHMFKKEFRKLYALITTIVLGLVGLIALGRNPLTMLSEIWFKLMRPFASLTSRLELTVAENAQPFLVDWINQMGKPIFWLFFLGIILIGMDFSRRIERKRYRLGFNLMWIFFV